MISLRHGAAKSLTMTLGLVGTFACTQGDASNDTDGLDGGTSSGDADAAGDDDAPGEDGGDDDGPGADVPIEPPPVEMIVAAASGGVVDVSCDDGLTWTEAWVGDPSYDGDGDHGQYALHGLDFGNGALYLAFGWGAPTGLYFRSVDGETWTQMAPDPSIMDDEVPTPFTIAVDHDHVVIAGGRAVVTSDDAGQTWSEVAQLPDVTQLDPEAQIKHPKLAQGGGAHVIVANDWIFHSQDGGATWNIADLPAEGCGTQAVDYGAGVFVAAASDAPICTSTDGETWTVATTPAMPGSVGRRGVNFTGERFVINQQWGNAGLTSDDGLTWTDSDGGPGGQLTRTSIGTLIAVASGGGGGAIQRSVDGGDTWEVVHDRSQDAEPVRFRRVVAGEVAVSALCPAD